MSAAVHPPLLIDPENLAAPLIKALHGGPASRGVTLDINEQDLPQKVGKAFV
jgi:hypothetical protein